MITHFDIGGGAFHNYHSDAVPFCMKRYVETLTATCPKLFSHYNIVTEFGRFVHAPTACAYSEVVQILDRSSSRIALSQFGSDLFLRLCYMPDVWFFNLSVLDSFGNEKASQLQPQTIAGPLCFSGDILFKNRPLPQIDMGDYLVFHDVGAYTFSMWSAYCSRYFPLCLGIKNEGTEVFVLRRSDQKQDLIEFWSRK